MLTALAEFKTAFRCNPLICSGRFSPLPCKFARSANRYSVSSHCSYTLLHWTTISLSHTLHSSQKMISLPLFLNVHQQDRPVTRTVFLSRTWPRMQDTIRPFLTNKKPLFFFFLFFKWKTKPLFHSLWSLLCTIKYLKCTILNLKVNLDKNISSKELMIDFLYTRKPW